MWPIFSNEDSDWYDASHPHLNESYFLGGYLSDTTITYNPNGGYTMACAESQFYQDYNASSYHTLENKLNGIVWFTYTNARDKSIIRKAAPAYQDVDESTKIHELGNELIFECASSSNILIVNEIGAIEKHFSNLNLLTINKSDFIPGIYFSIIYNNKKVINYKFIVIK